MTASVFLPEDLPPSARSASGFAWNDNVGWINFGDENSASTGHVYVSDDKLYGYAWGENIGWISMTCSNDTDCTNEYGVSQEPDKSGVLTGYAWGENIGWISFNCNNVPGSCSASNYKVTIATSTGRFSGYAWGENIGWILFPEDDYGVKTDWIYHTLTYTADVNGTITGSSTQTVFDGDNGTAVTAEPNEHYHFVNWNDGATTTSRTDTNILNDLTVTANFAIDSYTLNYIASTSTDPDAQIIGSSTQLVAYGESGTAVTASPSTNYKFDNWDDGISTATRTDTSASSSVTVTANFKIKGGSTPPATPDCTYTTPIWGVCNLSGTQMGTSTATNQTCNGDDPKTVSQSCTPEINISINPSATTTIFVGDKIQFIATVTGTTTIDVTWILPDEASGILDNGLYTAPETGGIFHVMVRPQADTNKSAIAVIDVRLKPLCTGYNYTAWGECINDSQSRVASTSIPFGCAGGAIATTTQSCTMASSTATTTVTSCISYTYSDWSSCINGEQSRLTLASNPDNCTGGPAQINNQSCTNEPAVIVPIVPTTEIPDNTTNGNNNSNSNNNTTNNNHTGGSGNRNNNEVPAILDISNFVADNIVAVLGTTTEKIFLGAKKIAESDAGSVVTKTITTAGVIGGGVAATGVFAVNGTVAADLLFLPFKLWGLLLSALGLKKRNRPWGTVYDSVTKQPLDPAYVTLKRLGGTEENTSITDLDGRYGFLVSPGQYVLTANKTNYLFPSKKMLGKTDTLYNNLYFGETIDIQNFGALISKNIPLDPLKFDWNEFVKGKKKLMKFYSRREKIVRLVTDWIFRIGFIISLVSLFLVSAPYNLIIFGLYMVLTALRKMGLKQKALGTLTESNGDPLSFAIVRVFASDLNVEITNKVADRIGRYYCLVNKGKYYVKIDKKNDDESYSTIFTSPAFEAENGIVNKNFIV